MWILGLRPPSRGHMFLSLFTPESCTYVFQVNIWFWVVLRWNNLHIFVSERCWITSAVDQSLTFINMWLQCDRQLSQFSRGPALQSEQNAYLPKAKCVFCKHPQSGMELGAWKNYPSKDDWKENSLPMMGKRKRSMKETWINGSLI